MSSPDPDLSAEEAVVAYHERTKHHFTRFAASLGRLDWKTQPNPFRRYHGAPLVRLPLAESSPSLEFRDLYTPELVPAAPLTTSDTRLAAPRSPPLRSAGGSACSIG